VWERGAVEAREKEKILRDEEDSSMLHIYEDSMNPTET
jgi:hypothetical protein